MADMKFVMNVLEAFEDVSADSGNIRLTKLYARAGENGRKGYRKWTKAVDEEYWISCMESLA